jgi:hypothetical protein
MDSAGSSSSRLVASDPAFVITCWRKVYDSLPDNDHVDRAAIPHDDVALEDDARKVRALAIIKAARHWSGRVHYVAEVDLESRCVEGAGHEESNL